MCRCHFARVLLRHTVARDAFWQIPPLNQQFQHPDPDMMSVQGWLNVRYKWFSLHAAVSIEGSNREGLRQLFHLFFVGGARSSTNLSLLSYMEPDDPSSLISIQNPSACRCRLLHVVPISRVLPAASAVRKGLVLVIRFILRNCFQGDQFAGVRT